MAWVSEKAPGSHGIPWGFWRRGRDQVGGWEEEEREKTGKEGREGLERRWLRGCGRGVARKER